MKNRLTYLIPFILLAILVLSLHFSLPPPKTFGVKAIKGIWEGEFTWLDKTNRFPVSIIFNDDGTYQFDTVLRRAKGKIRIEGMKIFLIEEGIAELGIKQSPLVLQLNDGKPFISGKLKEIGIYHFKRIK